MSAIEAMNEHIERLSKRIGTLSELHAAYQARATIINQMGINAELLALAKRYAEECAECGGKGSVWSMPRDPQKSVESPCPECADIWAVIDRAEGRA